jgi:hypothetical protein
MFITPSKPSEWATSGLEEELSFTLILMYFRQKSHSAHAEHALTLNHESAEYETNQIQI